MTPTQLAQMVVKISADPGELTKNLAMAQDALKSWATKVEAFAKKFTMYISAPLAAFGTLAVKAAAAAEGAAHPFEMMLKGEKAAADMLREIHSLADRTPYTTAQLREAGRAMLAMGVDAGEIIPLLETMSDAVTYLGINEAGLETLTHAFARLDAQGKATSRTFVTIGMLGIPAWKMLAEYIGISVPAAMKAVEEGAVSSGVALAALKTGMKDLYGGTSRTALGELETKWKTLKDTIQQFRIAAGQAIDENLGLRKVLDKTIGAVDDLTTWFKGLDKNTKEWIVDVGLLATALGPVLWGLSKLATFLRAVYLPVMALAIDIITGPIGLVAALVALGVAIVDSTYGWDRYVKDLEDGWDRLKKRFQEPIFKGISKEAIDEANRTYGRDIGGMSRKPPGWKAPGASLASVLAPPGGVAPSGGGMAEEASAAAIISPIFQEASTSCENFNSELAILRNNYGDLSGLSLAWKEELDKIPYVEQEIARGGLGMITSISSGISEGIAQILVYGAKGRDVMKATMKQILSTVLSTLLQIAITRSVYTALGISQEGAYTGAAVAGSTARAGSAAYASVWERVGWPLALVLAAVVAALAIAGAVAAGSSGKSSGSKVGASIKSMPAAAEGGIFTRPFLIGEAGRPEIALTRENVRTFLGEGLGGVVNLILDGDLLARGVLRREGRILALEGIR